MECDTAQWLETIGQWALVVVIGGFMFLTYLPMKKYYDRLEADAARYNAKNALSKKFDIEPIEGEDHVR